ncbi:MAG TPA: rhomboid family intramembrane serine protease [Xanthobacteraceae bacterium]|nr:rhomboid family intramembrane serine protease [Xanthobacteraceae bacterium]
MNYANFPFEARRQPALNLPPVIIALSAILIAVHVLRQFLSQEADLKVLLWTAFLPARYSHVPVLNGLLPGGLPADIWTFVTYAFLHGDAIHLAVNLIWFLAFGSAVAWRFGTLRFLLFCAVTAAAGAALHLFFFRGDVAPLVGASAAISGAMAAAVRFAFEAGGPLGPWRNSGPEAFRVPASPLLRALRNPQVLVFLGVWFGLNLLFGLTSAMTNLSEGSVAWQAHIGGFVAGLLLFPLFDPVRRPTVH